MNRDHANGYEAGLAQAAIWNAMTAATALESAANRIERAERNGALARADRLHIAGAIELVEQALARLRKAAAPRPAEMERDAA